MKLPIVNECKFCKRIFSSVWIYRIHLNEIHDLYENFERKIVRKVHRQSAAYEQQEDIQLNKNQQHSAKQHVAQRPPGRQELSCERQLKEKHIKSSHISKTIKPYTRRQEAYFQPPLTPQEGTAESLAPNERTAESLAPNEGTAESLAPNEGTAESLATQDGTAESFATQEETIGSIAPQAYKQQENRQLNKHQHQSAKRDVTERRPQTPKLSCERQLKEKNMESLHISKRAKPYTKRQQAYLQPLTPQEGTIKSLTPKKRTAETIAAQEGTAESLVAQEETAKSLVAQEGSAENIAPQEGTTESLAPQEYKQQKETQLNKHHQQTAKQHVAQRPPQRQELSCDRQLKEKQHMKSPHISKTVKSYTKHKQAHFQSPTAEEGTAESLASKEGTAESLASKEGTAERSLSPPEQFREGSPLQKGLSSPFGSSLLSSPFTDYEESSSDFEGSASSFQKENIELPCTPQIMAEHRLILSQVVEGGIQDYSLSPQKETVELSCTFEDTINISPISSPAVERTFQEPSLSSDFQGSSLSPTIEGLRRNLQNPPLSPDLQSPFSSIHGVGRNHQNPSFLPTLEKPLKDPPPSLTSEVPSQDLTGLSTSFLTLEGYSKDLQHYSSSHDIEGPCQDLHGPSSSSTAVERASHNLQNSSLSPISELPSQDLQGFSPPFQRLENTSQDLQCSSYPDIADPSPALEGQLPSSIINSTLSPYAQEFFPHWFFVQPNIWNRDFGYYTQSGLYVNSNYPLLVQPVTYFMEYDYQIPYFTEEGLFQIPPQNMQ